MRAEYGSAHIRAACIGQDSFHEEPNCSGEPEAYNSHCCWAVVPLLLATLGARVPLTVGVRESPFTPVQTRLRH